MHENTAEFVNTSEVAVLLGLSKSRIDEFVKTRPLKPCVRDGRKLFALVDVLKFAAHRKRHPSKMGRPTLMSQLQRKLNSSRLVPATKPADRRGASAANNGGTGVSKPPAPHRV